MKPAGMPRQAPRSSARSDDVRRRRRRLAPPPPSSCCCCCCCCCCCLIIFCLAVGTADILEERKPCLLPERGRGRGRGNRSYVCASELS
eukprot:763455-Hanusia_phi.AAC.2